MGAEYFEEYGEGLDADEVFTNLVSKAQYDFGHAGYTGTIAEKNKFETVSDPRLLVKNINGYLPEIHDWAVDYDSLYPHDKWGAACHIPVKNESENIIGHFFFGWASS